jgi:hypothetical protein
LPRSDGSKPFSNGVPRSPITRLSLLIALLAVAAFSPALGFGWVYDDAWTIVENDWLNRPLPELLGLLGSGEALARKVPDATRPAMVLSLWVDRRLFGLSPLGHHLTSLLLYGATAFLATRLAFRLSARTAVAAVAGAFFALAPIHAEPVASVNYREDLLSAFGMLAAWLALVERGRTETSGRMFVAGAGFALSLFAKESSVALVPLVLATYVLLPRLRPLIARRRRTLFALATGFALWALWRVPLLVQGDDIPVAPDRGALQMLLRSARYEVLAVRHAVLPFSWSPDYFRQPDAAPSWGVPLLAIGFGIWVFARAPGTRTPGLAGAVALLAPLGSSPLVGPSNELADRYFFLGVLGGGLFWGFLVDRLVTTRGWRIPRASTLVVCLPMAVPAWFATQIWCDERSLWTAAVERSPSSPRALSGLARVERQAGDHGSAQRLVERALEIDPRYAPALMVRIYNELASGNVAQARAHIDELPSLGAADARGLKKARRCAALDAAAARTCIGK